MKNMQIQVDPSGWDDARPTDVQVLLTDVASHIEKFLREPMLGIIQVRPAPSYDCVPRTRLRLSERETFPIQLTGTVQGRDWAKFSYQFSHEFCHVLSKYERIEGNPNNWFHEAICELASVFTLRQMAEQWPIYPPYPNWADCAGELSNYSDDLLSREECQLDPRKTLATWLLQEEESLRCDRYQRDKNAVVSYSLLPIVEDEPTGWNAVRSLPESSEGLKAYLHAWSLHVDPLDRPFVDRVIQLFEG